MLAFWLDGWAIPQSGTPADSSKDFVLWNNARISTDTFKIAMQYLFYYGLVVAACRWWAMADPKRKERFRLFPIVASGFWAGALLFLWPWGEASPALAFAPLIIAAVCVQVTSPWTPPVVVRPVARPVGRKHRYAV